jgi:hypothetical protein
VYQDAGVISCVDGTAVQQWTDISGNGRNLTAGTSPTWKGLLYGPSTNEPAVRFASASSTFLSNPYNSAIPRTIIIVGKSTGSTWQEWAGGLGSGGGYDAYYFSPCDGVNVWNNTQVSTTNLNSTDLQAWSPRQSGLYIDAMRLTTSGGTSILERFHDGVRTAQCSTTVALVAVNNGASVGAGYFAQAQTDYLDGDICELVMFSSALSDAELEQWMTALQARWNTPTAGGIGDRLTQTYLASTFANRPGDTNGADTHETLFLLSSTTPNTFYYYKPDYTPPGTEAVRDPSLFTLYQGSPVWVICTNRSYSDGNFTANNPTFSLLKSTDSGRTFTKWATVNGPSGTCICWAPEWVKNLDNSIYLDGSGLPHVIFAANLSLDDLTFQLYETHPTSADYTSWNSVSARCRPSSTVVYAGGFPSLRRPPDGHPSLA